MARISKNAGSLRVSAVLSRYFPVPQLAASFRYHSVVLHVAGESGERFVLCLACLECAVITLRLFLKVIFCNISLHEIYIYIHIYIYIKYI